MCTRMRKSYILTLAQSCLATAMLGGCAVKPLPKPVLPPPPVKPLPPYSWNPGVREGAPKIVVDVGAQRAFFYRGDVQVGETKCSSGKKGFETPVGSYAVIQKNKDHVSNLYGNFVSEDGTIVKRDVDMSKMKVPDGCAFQGAKMPYFMRFTGGYGMHSGNVPSYPASHGCVRLPRIMAQRFFENSRMGTPVIVQY